MNIFIVVVYLLIAINTTYFVGKSLYTNGEAFLQSMFHERSEIVKPLNKILLIGFYLVNIGFVLLFVVQQNQINTLIQCIELLARKLGIVYLTLGVMHAFNVMLFMYLEKTYKKSKN